MQAAPPFAEVADRTVDLVYTGRVLQHIAPEYARRYIRELARVLAPGGFLSFDVPSRALEAPALPAGALPASAYRAALAVTDCEVVPGADGDVVVLGLRLTNASNETWPAGVGVNLGNHWLTRDGAVVVPDDQRVAVPLPLAPAASVALRFTASLPDNPGARIIELDVVHEGVAWFAWLGSETVRVDVGATGRTTDQGPAVAMASTPPAFEPVMEMHAVPREDVEALLHAGGVRLVRVRMRTPLRSALGGLPLRRHRGRSRLSFSRAQTSTARRAGGVPLILAQGHHQVELRGPSGGDIARRRGQRREGDVALYSTGTHDSSGLKTVIAGARASVFGPRSCWRTTPSGPTMNVITPVTSYSAGQATSANPPDMTSFTT